MKFVVFSLGCRVNQYEGQSMVKKFIEHGFEATDRLEYADAYVINTCSVTSEADKKSRQAVARVKKLNKDAKVYVLGCSSQNNSKPFEEKDGVILVGGVADKMEFVTKILDTLSGKCDKTVEIAPLPTVYEDDFSPSLTNSRAYIKVQDGCNNFCSYCIIPYLRGRSRSRSLDSIYDEASSLIGKTRELVITGINVSAYGKDIGLNVIDLIRRLADIPMRKRFGSLECTVINDEMLQAMKDSGFCGSFHLSMQSGCDSVLKKMNRRYTSEQFLQIVGLIRKYYPDAGITTDVIAGFPEESEEEFLQTVETCSKAKFLHMHVFPYSERAGTKASKMQQVDKAIRVERANRLIQLSENMKNDFLSSQTGAIHEVFIEEKEGDYNVGYTDNFIKVYSLAPIGSCLKHKLTEIYGEGVKGETV
ncbi:MAG: tRNA (N(6)-L-threonylcarbamoyladenosine(37)-C(2))-methylthiotransferase MtaB [Clostridia bacterium]|nr:tRNA (N(6)-L-threonylcarbamoyladenosine(37)-C(2))-methylthiotransferase MtaB [Clostridia bacterium]